MLWWLPNIGGYPSAYYTVPSGLQWGEDRAQNGGRRGSRTWRFDGRRRTFAFADSESHGIGAYAIDPSSRAGIRRRNKKRGRIYIDYKL